MKRFTKPNNNNILSLSIRPLLHSIHRVTWHKYFSRNLPKGLFLLVELPVIYKMKGAKSSAPRQIILNRSSELPTLNVYIQRYSTTNKHGNINKCSTWIVRICWSVTIKISLKLLLWLQNTKIIFWKTLRDFHVKHQYQD